uniref:Putative salivary lipocalin n=1 Tax=Ixodes ricinus TaxID=34613 RepID=A0A0K8RCF6_IXORI
MKLFFIITIASLFSAAKCTSSCKCQPEDLLLHQYTELDAYRNPWNFLTSKDRLYLMYMPVSVNLNGIQCVTSEWGKVEIKGKQLQRKVTWIKAVQKEKRSKNVDISITYSAITTQSQLAS